MFSQRSDTHVPPATAAPVAGNSFGIFPAFVREAVCKQVQNVLADDGIFVVGFWWVVSGRQRAPATVICVRVGGLPWQAHVLST